MQTKNYSKIELSKCKYAILPLSKIAKESDVNFSIHGCSFSWSGFLGKLKVQMGTDNQWCDSLAANKSYKEEVLHDSIFGLRTFAFSYRMMAHENS